MCVVALGVLSSVPAWAQDACDDCAARYLDLAKEQRLQAEVDYLLPTDPLELDPAKRARDRRAKDAEDDSEDAISPESERIGWLLISGLILGGLAFVIFQNSAGSLVSFGSKPKDAKKTPLRRAAAKTGKSANDGLPKSEAAFLEKIAQMEDRREALHLLAARLLANAAEKTGIRPGRSWTARESLRALPRNWVHMTDLRHLNRQAELAWFGGYHVEENVFEDCLERARVMMQVGAVR